MKFPWRVRCTRCDRVIESGSERAAGKNPVGVRAMIVRDCLLERNQLFGVVVTTTPFCRLILDVNRGPGVGWTRVYGVRFGEVERERDEAPPGQGA